MPKTKGWRPTAIHQSKNETKFGWLEIPTDQQMEFPTFWKRWNISNIFPSHIKSQICFPSSLTVPLGFFGRLWAAKCPRRNVKWNCFLALQSYSRFRAWDKKIPLPQSKFLRIIGSFRQICFEIHPGREAFVPFIVLNKLRVKAFCSSTSVYSWI